MSVHPASAADEDFPDQEEDQEALQATLFLELEHLLNKYSAENESDTPDFVLAEYLLWCLSAFDRATRKRSQWYGCNCHSLGVSLDPQRRFRGWRGRVAGRCAYGLLCWFLGAIGGTPGYGTLRRGWSVGDGLGRG